MLSAEPSSLQFLEELPKDPPQLLRYDGTVRVAASQSGFFKGTFLVSQPLLALTYSTPCMILLVGTPGSAHHLPRSYREFRAR